MNFNQLPIMLNYREEANNPVCLMDDILLKDPNLYIPNKAPTTSSLILKNSPLTRQLTTAYIFNSKENINKNLATGKSTSGTTLYESISPKTYKNLVGITDPIWFDNTFLIPLASNMTISFAVTPIKTVTKESYFFILANNLNFWYRHSMGYMRAYVDGLNLDWSVTPVVGYTYHFTLICQGGVSNGTTLWMNGVWKQQTTSTCSFIQPSYSCALNSSDEWLMSYFYVWHRLFAHSDLKGITLDPYQIVDIQ
jgi:hypothetical protein